MRRLLVAGLIVLAACTPGTRATDSTSPPAVATVAVQPSTIPSPTPQPAVQAMLPAELEGIEMHTFAVGGDILERLAAGLGVSSGAIEVAFASRHDARFVQMYALRVAGVAGDALRDAFATAAYPSLVPDVERRTEVVGGREVAVVHSPATAPRLGTFHLLTDGDTLLVVQAFDAAMAADAIAALP